MLSDTRELVNCVYLGEMQILQFPIVLPLIFNHPCRLGFLNKLVIWQILCFVCNLKLHVFVDNLEDNWRAYVIWHKRAGKLRLLEGDANTAVSNSASNGCHKKQEVVILLL
jgi:hypothetical protein